jgi:hypothetical protein
MAAARDGYGMVIGASAAGKLQEIKLRGRLRAASELLAGRLARNLLSPFFTPQRAHIAELAILLFASSAFTQPKYSMGQSLPIVPSSRRPSSIWQQA